MTFPVYFASVRKNVHIYVDHTDRYADRIDRFTVGPINQGTMTLNDLLYSINLMWGVTTKPGDCKIEQSKFVIGGVDLTRTSS